MKRFVIGSVCCLALVALCSSSVMAQRSGRRGGWGGMRPHPAMLLGRNEQLQKELKITDEQKEKIKAISDELFAGGAGFGRRQDESAEEREKRREEGRKRSAEARKKIAEVLNAEQNQRLLGIALQIQGVAAWTDPEVVKELKLSDDTVKQLKTISEEAGKKRTELYGKLSRESSREEWGKAREEAEKISKEAEEESLAQLSAEQKTALDKLKGAKFELDWSAFGGRGGRGGRNRDGEKKAEDKKS